MKKLLSDDELAEHRDYVDSETDTPGWEHGDVARAHGRLLAAYEASEQTRRVSVWVVCFDDASHRSYRVIAFAKTSIVARKAANKWAYDHHVDGPRDFAAKLLDLDYCSGRAFEDMLDLWAASQAAGQESER